MPHPAGRKEQGRAKLVEGAGRSFRRHGFAGAGVDALAREAGFTSGALFAHFRNKAALFEAVVASGLADLRTGIEGFRQSDGQGWRRAFARFYLGERRTCDIETSCALQSLTGDVARAGPEARAAYTAELKRVIEAATDGPEGRAGAIAMLALLSGGVSLARAVDDPKLADEIAAAVAAALGLGD